MKRLIVSCSCIAVLLACGIVYAQTLQPLQPSHAASQEGLSDQQQATSDANIDAQRDVNGALWFLGGAGCGICIFGYAAIDVPQVPSGRLMGKSPEYIATYTAEYQSKAKRKRITRSALGWGTWIVLYLAFLISADN